MKQKILISACLLGEKVRYDGGDCFLADARLTQWQAEGRLLPICPEMAGGLTTPRTPAEIEGGEAMAVLVRAGRVVNRDGVDVTDQFLRGAQMALALAGEQQIAFAILKEGSPSCGVQRINDGSFSGRKIDGMGVTATLLSGNDIPVFSEEQLDAAAELLARLTADE